MAFEAFCRRVIGQFHDQENKDCEDYGLTHEAENGNYKIFAVADGLGDLRCVRSGIGSRLACESARDCLAEFAERILREDQGYTGELITERIPDELIKPVCKTWRKRVKEHFKSVQMSEEEKTDSEITTCGDDFQVEKLYNTTLIAGLLLEERYLVLLQQGDGHCIVLGENGDSSFPIPWDADCIGNVTTVMGGHDVTERMRSALLDLQRTKISACFLATDGLEDSFTSLSELSLELSNIALEAAASVPITGYLPQLADKLSKYTQFGSGDDITVAVILNAEHIVSIQDTWKEKIEESRRILALEKTILSAEDKLRSMTRKHEKLEQQYNALVMQTKRKNEEMSRLSDEISRTEQALAQIKEEYDPYHAKFQEQIARRDAARTELDMLKRGES